jgi:hypothetical protein
MKYKIFYALLLGCFTCFFDNPLYCQNNANGERDSILTPYRQEAKPVSFIVPSCLFILGATGINQHDFLIKSSLIKSERDKYAAHFHLEADNYLQFAPLAAGFIYGARYGKHSLVDYTKKAVLAEAFVIVSSQILKRTIAEKRPDSDARNSFPSGHTTQAFASATLFADEFGKGRPWLQVAAYACATTVGVFRVLNNRHWANDVVAGAGLGMLSAKASEVIFSKRKPKIIHDY